MFTSELEHLQLQVEWLTSSTFIVMLETGSIVAMVSSVESKCDVLIFCSGNIQVYSWRGCGNWDRFAKSSRGNFSTKIWGYSVFNQWLWSICRNSYDSLTSNQDCQKRRWVQPFVSLHDILLIPVECMYWCVLLNGVLWRLLDSLLIIVPKLKADLAILETLEAWKALVFRPPVSQRWLVKVSKEYFSTS